MDDLFTAIGLVLVIEGVLYAGAPSMAKRMALEAAGADESKLRLGGLIALAIGFGIVWLVRG